MDLSFSAAELAFRDEVRAWLATAMPPPMREKAAIDAEFSLEEMRDWHRILHAKGWIAPHWPKQHGGGGMDPSRQFLLQEELDLSGAPPLSPFGLRMLGPVLMEHGTPAQQQRFLPAILSGESSWCQGYSEPNAGSDLASLRTAAEIGADGSLIVTGQKTWTTWAQHADWIFCLVRTDGSGKKQEGITFLLIDMKTPGITVRPVLTIGGTEAFCETFFDRVVVPRDQVVGPLHGGWTVAKSLLSHERISLGAVGRSRRELARVKKIAAATRIDGGCLFDEPRFRAKIARLEIDLRALEVTNWRALCSAQAGRSDGPAASVLKIRGSELIQQCFELAMEAMGHDSLAWDEHADAIPPIERTVAAHFSHLRAATIYGGSNEIQRNLIARTIMGLPR